MAVVEDISLDWGFQPVVLTSNNTFTLNGASANLNQIAFAFVAQSTTTLQTFRFRAGTKAGTGGTITCNAQADSNGAPSNVSLGSLTVGAISANSYVDCTGGTVAVTKGTKYWVVLSNNDAAPNTNNIIVVYPAGNQSNYQTRSDDATTANTGTTWTQRPATGGGRFGFADGTYLGFIVSNVAALTGTQGVYSANEAGARFTTPANESMVVAGLFMGINVNGAPTGNPFLKLYDASHNLLGSTFQITNGEATTNTAKYYQRLFDPTTVAGNASTITLSPNTTYTVTLAESTQSDTSTNQFRVYGCTWDPDVNSLGLIPWNWQADILNGGTWTQTNNLLIPCGLILATGNEFASSGGGGGLLRYPQMAGFG